MREIINWKYFKKKWKSPRCPPPSTVQSIDVLLNVENGRPKIQNTDNHGTYVEDGLRPLQTGTFCWLFSPFYYLWLIGRVIDDWNMKNLSCQLFVVFGLHPPPRTPIGEQWRKGRIVQLPTPLFLFRASERCWNEWTTKVSSKTTVLIT